jgi:hypothetical protein
MAVIPTVNCAYRSRGRRQMRPICQIHPREQAKKVAGFVLQKIKNNEIPPTVTKEELHALGALK